MVKEKIGRILLSSCNKSTKQRIENVIFEGKEERFNKGELSKVKFYNYHLFNELDIFNRNKTLKKSQDSEILIRLFMLGYQFCPEKLIADLSAFQGRVSFYKEMKVTEEFLFEDLEYKFQEEDILTLELCASEYIKKFPNIVEQYLKLKDNPKIALFLMIQELLKGKKEKLNDIEKLILKTLCRIYSTQRIKNILALDLGAKELAETLEEVEVDLEEELLELLEVKFLDIKEELKNREIISTLLEILKFPTYLRECDLENEEDVYNTIKNSSLPTIYKLVYMYQASEELDIIPYLKEYISENSLQCIELLDRMCKQNIELGTMMLVVLIDNGALKKDSIYVDSYKKQINLLLETIKESDEEELEVRVINALGYMLVFIDVEEEIEKINLHYINRKRDLNEFINLLSHFERVVLEDRGVNPWKILERCTDIDKEFLITGTLDFVMVNSIKEFTEFLKENEEIYYELLEKRAFKGMKFLEISFYTYRSQIEFDPTKLLSYLNEEDNIVLEEIFDILKDKESSCLSEVERLSKVKNRKFLFNANKLKDIWEKNRDLKFETIEELEDYCQRYLKAKKRDIPYFKDEVYKKVRVKDSQRFIDESVLKCYSSLYIESDKFDKIKLTNTIREFLNIEDLREFSGKLYRCYLDNRAPQKYINIVKMLLVVADDYWIGRLLQQCRENIQLGKFDLVIEYLNLMVISERKDILALLKYIKTVDREDEISQYLNLEEKLYNSFVNQVLNEVSEESLDLALGFDEKGEKILDYGNRKIKLKLDNEFNLTIENQDGKELKSLPKASIKFQDNIERVEFYQRELKELKKKIKNIKN